MARRSLSLSGSATPLPLRLSDVDIVAEPEDDEPSARIDGASIAALLEVAADTDRLLDPEDISLELEHVADLLGALAERAEPPTAGALSLAEHCVRRLAARVDGLRPAARSRSRRFVIARRVRAAPSEYRARWTLRARCLEIRLAIRDEVHQERHEQGGGHPVQAHAQR